MTHSLGGPKCEAMDKNMECLYSDEVKAVKL